MNPHTGGILPPGDVDELLDVADLLWLMVHLMNCTSRFSKILAYHGEGFPGGYYPFGVDVVLLIERA